jgi:hypothetical protein
MTAIATERGLIVLVCGGIATLAVQVVRRSATPPQG